MRIGKCTEKVQYKKEKIILSGEEYIDFLHDLENDNFLEYYYENNLLF